MPLRTAVGAEILPGYHLVEKIGTGGYGEVWKVTAPGGLTKAVKIIFGEVGEARAEQELKALSRIREVRHPFLLSLERFEIVDGQLLIVSELAESSLLDRFVACCEQGLMGIPRDELLNYLRDAAEGLDFMNEIHGLQHLDIKPENLLLLGGRIKIGDFGLVKDFHAARVTVTSGVTAVYATPEAFDGKVSRFSDQYSLAIVYQEMLTGIRPFSGTTTFQLAFQHTSCPPQVEVLPPADQPVILRALAKIPEERFLTCAEMVSALLHGTLPVAKPAAAKLKAPIMEDAEVGIEEAAEAEPPEEVSIELDKSIDVEATPGQSAFTTPRIEGLADVPIGTSLPWSTAHIKLRPTFFLGIGTLAGWTMRRLRRRLADRFGRPDNVPIFGFLLLDSDRDALRQARQGDGHVALAMQETLLTPLHRPEYYRSRSKDLLRWLDRGWLYGIPGSLHTEGSRPLGRLALIDNLPEIRRAVREGIGRINSPAAKTATQQATGLGLGDAAPRVVVIASPDGGGCGGLLDIAFTMRQMLGDMGLARATVDAMLVHATSPKPAQQDLARINAYATLREIYHFCRPGQTYPGAPERGLRPAAVGTLPFADCCFVHLGDSLVEAEAEAATDLLAAYLYLDAATAAGEIIENNRTRRGPSVTNGEAGVYVRTLGLSQITFPRHALAERTGDLLCQAMVQRWRGHHASLKPEDLACAAREKFAELNLGIDSLTERVNALVPTALGEDADTFIQQLLPESGSSSQVWAEFTSTFLEKIDEVLGKGDSDIDTRTATLFDLTMSDQCQKLGNKLGSTLEEWLRDMVEDPHQRLSIAARYAQWFLEHLAGIGEFVKQQRAQFSACRQQMHGRLKGGGGTGKGSGVRWLAFARRQRPEAGPAVKFFEYWHVRLAEVSLTYVYEIMGVVRRYLSNFAQEVADCQQRLGALGERFKTATQTSPATSSSKTRPIQVVEVFPGEAEDLITASADTLDKLDPKFIDQVDVGFQRQILLPCGGLWSVLHNNDLLSNVRVQLRKRMRAALLEAMKNLDAARLYLQQQRKPAELRQNLTALMQAAIPQIAVSGGLAHLLFALPGGSSGEEIEATLTRIEPGASASVIDSEGDVIICREVAALPIEKVAEAVVGGNLTYAENASRVVSRTDLNWTNFPGLHQTSDVPQLDEV
jgi:serine/threonine protein kinase